MNKPAPSVTLVVVDSREVPKSKRGLSTFVLEEPLRNVIGVETQAFAVVSRNAKKIQLFVNSTEITVAIPDSGNLANLLDAALLKSEVGVRCEVGVTTGTLVFYSTQEEPFTITTPHWTYLGLEAVTTTSTLTPTQTQTATPTLEFGCMPGDSYASADLSLLQNAGLAIPAGEETTTPAVTIASSCLRLESLSFGGGQEGSVDARIVCDGEVVGTATSVSINTPNIPVSPSPLVLEKGKAYTVVATCTGDVITGIPRCGSGRYIAAKGTTAAFGDRQEVHGTSAAQQTSFVRLRSPFLETFAPTGGVLGGSFKHNCGLGVFSQNGSGNFLVNPGTYTWPLSHPLGKLMHFDLIVDDCIEEDIPEIEWRAVLKFTWVNPASTLETGLGSRSTR